MTSTAVSTLAVIADVALALVVLAGVAYAARRLQRPAVLWIGAGGVIAWFALAFTLARGGFFETDASTTLPPAIAPAIVIPTLLGCALLALAPARRVIESVPLHWLVGVQAYRVAGAVFLIAWLQHDVPPEFALPAGIGDVLVGIAAPLVALSLVRGGAAHARTRVLVWCALGILDLVVAITCGFLTAPSVFQQLALNDPNAAITSYPLVLIPIFAVPVSIVLHVYVIARLRVGVAGAGAAVAGARTM
jgi:hypothetical protein